MVSHLSTKHAVRPARRRPEFDPLENRLVLSQPGAVIFEGFLSAPASQGMGSGNGQTVFLAPMSPTPTVLAIEIFFQSTPGLAGGQGGNAALAVVFEDALLQVGNQVVSNGAGTSGSGSPGLSSPLPIGDGAVSLPAAPQTGAHGPGANNGSDGSTASRILVIPLTFPLNGNGGMTISAASAATHSGDAPAVAALAPVPQALLPGGRMALPLVPPARYELPEPFLFESPGSAVEEAPGLAPTQGQDVPRVPSEPERGAPAENSMPEADPGAVRAPDLEATRYQQLDAWLAAEGWRLASPGETAPAEPSQAYEQPVRDGAPALAAAGVAVVLWNVGNRLSTGRRTLTAEDVESKPRP